MTLRKRMDRVTSSKNVKPGKRSEFEKVITPMLNWPTGNIQHPVRHEAKLVPAVQFCTEIFSA